MKRVIAVVAVTCSAIIGLLALSTSAASASAEVNRGACMSSMPVELRHHQAPGQTGNGPLTIVGGNIIVPNAFDGGIGCTL